jgi:hypothetical protein
MISFRNTSALALTVLLSIAPAAQAISLPQINVAQITNGGKLLGAAATGAAFLYLVQDRSTPVIPTSDKVDNVLESKFVKPVADQVRNVWNRVYKHRDHILTAVAIGTLVYRSTEVRINDAHIRKAAEKAPVVGNFIAQYVK